jgi:hypothetical protein
MPPALGGGRPSSSENMNRSRFAASVQNGFGAVDEHVRYSSFAGILGVEQCQVAVADALPGGAVPSHVSAEVVEYGPTSESCSGSVAEVVPEAVASSRKCASPVAA